MGFETNGSTYLHIEGDGVGSTEGFVGIGTTIPQGELEVAGRIEISGTGGSVWIGEDAGVTDDGVDSQSVGIGFDALDLQSGVGVSQNVAVGYQALTGASTGSSNVAIGYKASSVMTTSTGTTAVGWSALEDNTANFNTAIGHSALLQNTGGTDNTAVGAFSLDLQTSGGHDNTAMGFNALTANTTGDQNVAVGFEALRDNSIGSRNVAIGNSAGNNSTGDSNIFIGHQTSDNLTAGSNNLLVGHNMDAQSATGSNQMSIGNLLFSEGIDGLGTTPSTGNLGVGDTTPDFKLEVAGSLGLLEQAAADADEAGTGQFWVRSDAPNTAMFTDDTGVDHVLSSAPAYKSFTYHARDAATGVNFSAGFYDSNVADANLTQASLTVTHGGADVPYGAHAFIVSGGNGTTDGSDLVLTVTGTSITDAGVRNAADSEVIEATAATSALDSYYETSKKWIGTITFTLSSTGGVTFNYDFNYGLAKYEDFGNRDFTVTDFEAVGLANANDAGFNVELMEHSATGWTFHATAFVPGNGVVVSMNTDYVTETDLDAGEQFSYKRSGLSTAISGSSGEGILVRVTTGTNNSVSYMDSHIGITFD